MVENSIEVLVEAGKATPGPPLGPALGPMGVNAKAVVDAINEKTKAFAGMKVPVKVAVDSGTKQFTVTVGSPPTASLLKKELGVEKGKKDSQYIGNLGFGNVLDIAKMKKDSLLANDMKTAVKEVVGTCVSLGIKVEGKTPKESLAAIDAGEYDKYISGKEQAAKSRETYKIIEVKKEAPAEAPAAPAEAEKPEKAEAKAGKDEKAADKKKGAAKGK
jgi:large subunit ribosomal protein L11